MGRFAAVVVALVVVSGLAATASAKPAVIDTTEATRGQWLLLADGSITSANGAPRLALATGETKVAKPVAIVAARRRGAWVIGTAGDVAAYGSAQPVADGHVRNVVDAAPGRRSGQLLVLDGAGRVRGLGGAKPLGDLARGKPAELVAAADGRGYWIVDSDGAIAAFGTAPRLQTTTGIQDVVAGVRTASGAGLWLVSRHGGVAAAGDAGYAPAADTAVAGAARDGADLLVATTDGKTVRIKPDTSGASKPVKPAPGGGGGTTPTPTTSTSTSTSTSSTVAPTTTTTSTTVAPTTTTTTAPPATRDLTRWPFASTSPWNLPIGDAATFASAADARTISLLLPTATPWINATQYSHPIYQATDADPMATVRRSGFADEHYRIPASATPAAGTDQHLHVIEPNGRWLHETWNTSGTSPSYTTGYHVLTDLTGPGMGQGGVRAYGGSAIGGLIRAWELDAGTIRHALALAITGDQLKSGWVWPATSQDGNAATTYHGNLPMGSYLAIPPAVNVDVLPLHVAGKVLARALQDYGAYVVDRAGAFTFFAEPSLGSDPRIADMRSDLAVIRATLGVVTNSSASNVNGGGTRRQPLAP